MCVLMVHLNMRSYTLLVLSQMSVCGQVTMILCGQVTSKHRLYLRFLVCLCYACTCPHTTVAAYTQRYPRLFAALASMEHEKCYSAADLFGPAADEAHLGEHGTLYTKGGCSFVQLYKHC